MATAATILTTPDWEISKDDCEESSSASTEKYKSLTIEHKEILCKLLTTDEGNAYIDEEVKNFVKDKFLSIPLPQQLYLFYYGFLWVLY